MEMQREKEKENNRRTFIHNNAERFESAQIGREK